MPASCQREKATRTRHDNDDDEDDGDCVTQCPLRRITGPGETRRRRRRRGHVESKRRKERREERRVETTTTTTTTTTMMLLWWQGSDPFRPWCLEPTTEGRVEDNEPTSTDQKATSQRTLKLLSQHQVHQQGKTNTVSCWSALPSCWSSRPPRELLLLHV